MDFTSDNDRGVYIMFAVRSKRHRGYALTFKIYFLIILFLIILWGVGGVIVHNKWKNYRDLHWEVSNLRHDVEVLKQRIGQ